MSIAIAVIGILVGALVAAIAIARARGAAASEYLAEKAFEAADKDRVEARKELADTQSFYAAEKARLEAVISQMKQEVASLENDALACSSPDAVRNRLRGLFGDVGRFEEETAPPGISLPRRTTS